MKPFPDSMRAIDRRWLAPLCLLVLLAAAGLATWLAALAPAGELTGIAVVLVALLLAALGLTGAMILKVRQVQSERQAQALDDQCIKEAIDALPFGVAIYDQQDRLLRFNQEAAEQAPYSDGGELIGQTYETMIRRSLARGAIPDAQGREEEWLRDRLEGRGKLNRPLLRPRPDGRWLHFYEISTPLGCLVMVRQDVTELVQKSVALERSNEQLELLSATDGLTGLANRRMFDQHLFAEWQRGMRSQQPISLLLIDIDHFKRYNDHYGHLAGDACLRQVAGVLFDCAQRAGEMVARYGGEEFALLLPGTNTDAAKKVAQLCMDEMAAAKIEHADSPVSDFLTLSIGVATVVASQDLVPESLVRCADEALYRVKNEGRGHYLVAPCPA